MDAEPLRRRDDNYLTRAEAIALRDEFHAAQLAQDIEWNKGFVALRSSQDASFARIEALLADYVRTDVFVARLTPVQAISYGIVALAVTLVMGMLAVALAGHTSSR